MAETFKTIKRVEFRDTDAAGLMHFSTYFTYMEEAEHELLRSLGTSVVVANEEHSWSWPQNRLLVGLLTISDRCNKTKDENDNRQTNSSGRTFPDL